MSRWTPLYATSPSGKTLFVCRCCGRVSPTPDKECQELPSVGPHKMAIKCILFEEFEQALAMTSGTEEHKDSQLWVGEGSEEGTVSVTLIQSDGKHITKKVVFSDEDKNKGRKERR